MLHVLDRQLERVRPLFKGLHLSLVIDAVAAGNSPGAIWVDDPAHPRSVFMWDKAHCYYLVGAAGDREFNAAIEKLIAERIAPAASARRVNVFKVYYSSEDWESKIEAIFGHASPAKMERVFYTLDRLRMPDWRERVPPGFCLDSINEQLLARRELKNISVVTDEIESCWNSLHDFVRNGFGFCLREGDTIAGWCTAEYVSGNQCGIGIETVKEYGRRGFATLTACAFVDYCSTHHIAPHWDSWKANTPSVAVAEKVGFKKALKYAVYFGKFNSEKR